MHFEPRRHRRGSSLYGALHSFQGFFYSLPVITVLPALANFQAILCRTAGVNIRSGSAMHFIMKEFGHGTHH